MPVLLSPEEMAAVTGGTWENLTPELQIEGIEYISKFLKEGDLYVVWHSNCRKIDAALKKGVHAVLAPNDCSVNVSIPVLKVENTYTALRKIALRATELSLATRVLVTGSYGKTGYKRHLYNVIKDQFKTYAKLNTANHVQSTYCNLGSLKDEHELFLIEQPVSTKVKTLRRAEYIHPDLCVITSIGHEHIERFHTVENIIENKTQIAKALKKGGKFLIPRDDPYYKQLKKALSKYDHFDLLTFGSHSSCDAYLLYSQYKEFGWDVIAKIEDVIVAYRVPFPQEHEPAASLAVLLSVYHLGGDVHAAAAKFYAATNFKSSGIIYEAVYREKAFYIYDQSFRGGIEGYQNFFKSLQYIRPREGGRIILLTSEFVDYQDGEMALIDHALFRKLIEDAGIDLLFTVEKFTEHINVLPDRSIWQNHSLDFHNIKDEILGCIEENDILIVKGIFESHLPEFMDWLKDHDELQMKEQHSRDMTTGMQKALKGCRIISIDDQSRYAEAVEAAKKNISSAHFPFLLTWAAATSLELLLAEDDGVVSLYFMRHFRHNSPPTFALFMPPMPLSEDALNHAMQRLYDYHGKQSGTIMWLEEKEVDLIRTWPIAEQMVFKDRHLDEFIYDPSVYQKLIGSRFRHLRRDVSLIEERDDVVVEMYEKRHEKACLELLESWEEIQGKKYDVLEDKISTRNTLHWADKFDSRSLFGLVVFISGELKSFGFSGRITEHTGTLFIGKSDHSIKGLHSYMRYEMLKRMQDMKWVNDSYAHGEGMVFSKRMFRPVKMLKQFKAVI